MSALVFVLVLTFATSDITSHCSIIFNFGVNYIMFWNIFGYGLVYYPYFGVGLVWLDYWYGIVGLDLVSHSCDPIPECSCKLLS